MSKNSIFKQGAERISSGISSGLVLDQNEFLSSSILTRMRGYLKTRAVLTQTETVFIDFKRKQFPAQAIGIYERVVHAHKKKDKVELMRNLSVPLYDIFKVCIKEDGRLPFLLYKDVLDAKLVQARIYSLHKHAMNPSQTWHQLTLKFTIYDEAEKKDVIKYNVFERREADPLSTDWRICHLE